MQLLHHISPTWLKAMYLSYCGSWLLRCGALCVINLVGSQMHLKLSAAMYQCL
jgi:hypothetical protein